MFLLLDCEKVNRHGEPVVVRIYPRWHSEMGAVLSQHHQRRDHEVHSADQQPDHAVCSQFG